MKRMRGGNAERSAFSKGEFAVIFDIVQKQGVIASCCRCSAPEHILDETDNVILSGYNSRPLDTIDIDDEQRLLCEWCFDNTLCSACDTSSETVQWVEYRDENLCRSCRQEFGISYCEACNKYRMNVAWYENTQHVHRADGFDRDDYFFSACPDCREKYASVVSDAEVSYYVGT